MFQFVEPSATLITEKDPLKLIESVGRTCYKSEDRITENSARGFVRGLMKSNHTAMVEHSNIVFDISLIRTPAGIRTALLIQRSNLLMAINGPRSGLINQLMHVVEVILFVALHVQLRRQGLVRALSPTVF